MRIIILIVVAWNIFVIDTNGQKILRGQYVFHRKDEFFSSWYFSMDSSFTSFQSGDMGTFYGEGKFKIRGDYLILKFDSTDIARRIQAKYFIVPNSVDSLKISSISRRSADIQCKYTGRIQTYSKVTRGSNKEDFDLFNLKLVVLNELIRKGYFKREIDSLKTKYWKSEDYSQKAIPEILHFFKGITISQRQLNTITTITFDGGNEIYHLLIPNWDGEDNRFDISDLSELKKLRHLEQIDVISMVHVDDYSVLARLNHLKKIIHWDDLRKRKDLVSQLEKRGVVVQ